MIVTPKFVHIHLHKAGGTFVNEAILQFIPGARRLGYHLPRSMIPDDCRHLPVLAFVRSPWSYYVSWYAFQSERSEPNALFRCLSEGGTLGFKPTIQNMLRLGEPCSRLDELLPQLPDDYGSSGLNLPRRCLEPIRGTRMGFYSYLVQYMFAGDGGPLLVGRAESLRRDLPGFLKKLAVPVGAEFHAFVADAPRRNTSRHGPWRDYYDSDLRAQVASADRGFLARYHYEFGRAAPQQ